MGRGRKSEDSFELRDGRQVGYSLKERQTKSGKVFRVVFRHPTEDKYMELSTGCSSKADAWTEAAKLIRMFPHMPAIIDGSQMQDAVPTLAVLAAFNTTPVRFVGIANLRVKECDRVAAMANELSRVVPGLAVEDGDDLVVASDPALAGKVLPARIETYSDHRIAMSMAATAPRSSRTGWRVMS